MGIGRWVEEFDKRTDPFGRDYFWLTGRYDPVEIVDGTDHHALENGFVSMVPLTLDMTNYAYLKNIAEYVQKG